MYLDRHNHERREGSTTTTTPRDIADSPVKKNGTESSMRKRGKDKDGGGSVVADDDGGDGDIKKDLGCPIAATVNEGNGDDDGESSGGGVMATDMGVFTSDEFPPRWWKVRGLLSDHKAADALLGEAVRLSFPDVDWVPLEVLSLIFEVG